MDSEQTATLRRMRLELALSRAEGRLERPCPPADECMDPECTCRVAMMTALLTERCAAQLAQTYRVMLSEIETERALLRNSREALRESRELLRRAIVARGARVG